MLELNNQNFNHLKIHTQYSICEGAIKIDNLKDFCKEKKNTLFRSVRYIQFMWCIGVC